MQTNSCISSPAQAGTELAPTSTLPADKPTGESLREGVLAVVLGLSRPAQPPTPWHFLQPPPNVQELNVSPDDIGARLNDRFGDKLAALGVTRCELFGSHPPVFDEENGRFVLACDSEGRPRDIVSSTGSLLHTTPLIISRVRAEESATTTAEIFAVQTIDELLVLRGLGFDAELSAGLADLSGSDFKAMLNSSTGKDGAGGIRIVLADFDVVSLTPGRWPYMTAILHQLARVQEVYKLDPAIRFTRWRPKIATAAAIQSACALQDPELVQRLMEKSVPGPQLGVTWNYHLQPVPLTYAVARATLHDLLRQSDSLPHAVEVKKALDRYRQLYQKSVLDGISGMAESAKNPVTRAITIPAVKAFERWFDSQRDVRAAKKVIAGNHPGDWDSQDDNFAEQLRLGDQLLKYAKFLSPKN